MSEIRELTNTFMDSPVRINFVMESLFSPANAMTVNADIKAPVKPKRQMLADSKRVIEITVASAAPEEIPVMYGSASGFLETHCMNIPASASELPAIIALMA